MKKKIYIPRIMPKISMSSKVFIDKKTKMGSKWGLVKILINSVMQSDHYKRAQRIGSKIHSRTNKNRMHRFVNLAKALFNKSACSNGRTFHCCFAVKKGKVLAIGKND